MFPLATIGYEGATLAQVIAKLWTAGVTMLVDVRAIASSRRPGFSKTILAAGLAEAGIEYRHLRVLGTPKAGRVAAHAGRIEDMRIIYEEYLQEPEAEAALAAAAELALHQPAALLCFEADAAKCHRAIVAHRIHERIGREIVDL